MILKRNRLFGYLFIILLISSLRITVAYAGTNGRTQAQAVAWANSQAGQTLEYPDSGLENPCFDLICCYYQELGQAIPWLNVDPSGGGGDFCPSEWQYTDSPQPGDVAVWLSDDNDHAAIVTEIRGAQMVCVEQNYGGKMYVTTNLHNIDAYAYIRPDFPSSQGSPISGGSRTVSDGDYHIVSALNADMGIDVARNGSANGTNVQLYNNLTDSNQVFTVKYLNNGFYRITHKSSGKVLDVVGAGLAYGTNVDIYSSNDTDAQMWRIDPSDNAGYLNIKAKCSGLCLDVDGAIAQNGTNIKTYVNNGSNAQKWKFIAVGENQTIADGDYHIVSALNSDMGMDVAGNRSEDATNIQLYSNVNDEKQVFTAKYLGNGYYQIMHKDSGKCIDMVGNSSLANTNIDIYRDNSTDAQKWIIKDAGNGYYNIICKGNGLYIDVDNASTQNGTNIKGYIGNGSNAQKWQFVPAGSEETAGTYEGELTAQYTKFIVKWLDGDGSVLQEKAYIEGNDPPAYDGEEPQKTATAQYTYAFSGWDKGTVDGITTTYSPLFDETTRQYAVTFMDYDGKTVLKEAVKYDYGTAVEKIEHPDDPTREADEEYAYSFAGWMPEIKEVTADTVYTAVYSGTKQRYTITWLQDDGTLIDETAVEYGEVPTHADSSRTGATRYFYTFAGWDPQIAQVTGNATYKATYTSALAPVPVKQGTGVGDTFKLPVGPVKKGYTLKLWNGPE